MIETLAFVAKNFSADHFGLIGLFLGFVVMLVVIFKRNLNLSFGKLSISVGGAKDSQDKKLSKNQIAHLFDYLVEKISERAYIKDETFIKQMNYVDEKILTIRTLFLNVYKNELGERIENEDIDIRNTPEYRSYKIVLDDALRECVKGKTLKKTLKTDDLLKLSEPSAWGVYLKQKQSFAWMFFQDHFELNYSEKIVKLDTLLEAHEKVKSQFQEEICDIYDKAKTIAIEQDEKIKQIDKEMKEKIETLESEQP